MFWIFLLTAAIILSVTFFLTTQISTGRPNAKSTYDLYGSLNPSMVCPHCRATGGVRTKAVTRKQGISGGKATAAVLTGGISLLATGLSRKEASTQARCDRCGSSWHF